MYPYWGYPKHWGFGYGCAQNTGIPKSLSAILYFKVRGLEPKLRKFGLGRKIPKLSQGADPAEDNDVFSNAPRVLLQCDTWLRLLYLLIKGFILRKCAVKEDCNSNWSRGNYPSSSCLRRLRPQYERQSKLSCPDRAEKRLRMSLIRAWIWKHEKRRGILPPIRLR